MNPEPNTIEVANAARTCPSPHPRLGPSIIPYNKLASATTERIAPIISSGFWFSSFERGTTMAPAIRTKRMIGTFKSHLKNMIKGVKEKHKYQLKITQRLKINIKLNNQRLF